MNYRLEANYVASVLAEVRTWEITADDCAFFAPFADHEDLTEGFWSAWDNVIECAEDVLNEAVARGISGYFFEELVRGINCHLALIKVPEVAGEINYKTYVCGNSHGYDFVR